jgi:hypothetical protein
MERQARLGQHTYQVRVSRKFDASGVVYFDADSVTVNNGTLMLSVEVPPLEDEDEETRNIETATCAVFAPGQWKTVVLVDPTKLQPFFRHDPHWMPDEED